jgi:ornithine cyclodeaminase/alanine dehydrogenase-like protein (mu-crystallin family)
MEKSHQITMLGTGLIGRFYTMTLHGQRKRDHVHVVYSRSEARAKSFASEWKILFEAWDENRNPRETFYDGYVVNAIIDACYKSARTKQWEPVALEDWRGLKEVAKIKAPAQEYEGQILIKRERMPDGTTKYILKDKKSGEIRSELK